MRKKLTSRKLWTSIASFASMLMIYFGHAESEATQVASLIMAAASVIAYVIGEGLADSCSTNDMCLGEPIDWGSISADTDESEE